MLVQSTRRKNGPPPETGVRARISAGIVAKSVQQARAHGAWNSFHQL